MTAPPTPMPAAADPLAGLRDWHLPEPVSWWPPAPGWWVLAALVCLGLGFAGYWWWRRRRRLAPLRAAISELYRLRSEFGDSRDARRFLAAVSGLMRRLALRRYPQVQVAGLTGSAWLEFLDRTGGGGGFSGAGRGLAQEPYRPPAYAAEVADTQAVALLADRWIRAQGKGL